LLLELMFRKKLRNLDMACEGVEDVEDPPGLLLKCRCECPFDDGGESVIFRSWAAPAPPAADVDDDDEEPPKIWVIT
jgi:hypothetical protein